MKTKKDIKQKVKEGNWVNSCDHVDGLCDCASQVIPDAEDVQAAVDGVVQGEHAMAFVTPDRVVVVTAGIFGGERQTEFALNDETEVECDENCICFRDSEHSIEIDTGTPHTSQRVADKVEECKASKAEAQAQAEAEDEDDDDEQAA